MRNANEKKIFHLLLDEIDDTLIVIESRCLRLDSADQAAELQVLFRAAHNVKGAAQLYGLTDLGTLVHIFEDLLNTLQRSVTTDNSRPVDDETTDLMLATQSFLRNWVRNLRDDENYSPDYQNIKRQLSSQIDLIKTRQVRAKVTSPPNAKKAQTPEATPSTLTAGPDVAAPTAPQEAAPSSPAAADRPRQKQQKQNKSNETIRIAAKKIDEIMRLIGELSINQGILSHNLAQATFNETTCQNSVELNQKALKELYENVLTLRMQSADTLFQRIERTVRELVRSQKKPVAVEFFGSETPIDKIVVEMITDPMMHLVRNAIDHGIEDEETRAKMGKSSQGKLKIQTLQEGGHIIITVADDGRGLDQTVILQKAIKLGLVPPGRKLNLEDTLKLICLPGFSTRDTVTEISGRGIGMDVVQKVIDNLGGHLEISTIKNQGTTFTIRLPANLEIIDGLTVRITDQLYVVPRQDITEIIDLRDHDVRRMGEDGRAIHFRGSVVPVEDLSDYIGMESESDSFPPVMGAKSTAQIALFIRLQGRAKLALCVDALLSQQQIVVRPLAEQLGKIPCFSGVTILGNGEPAMILNPAVIGSSYLKWIGGSTPPLVDSPPENGSYGETA